MHKGSRHFRCKVIEILPQIAYVYVVYLVLKYCQYV